ncbi:double-stranded RNA-specific adenosine deaminase-like isoform X2 [Saccostrea cucullata]|uniref:double-stranded RNA-specific adenosine deaminase-like isoform X2 n=1 Tax=Saccostrea cuccullata TaxID=36930 RepID=UPI002ED43CE6
MHSMAEIKEGKEEVRKDEELDRSTLHSLQKNSISAFMEYGQKIGRKPTLECHPVKRLRLFSGNPIFIASACIGEDVICTAEAPNKKDARTQAADMALRQMPRNLNVKQTFDESSTRMELAIPDKDPVSAFMEYAQSNGQTGCIVQDSQTGPSHCPTFYMHAELGNRVFQTVEHGNKKEGRKEAANVALLELQSEGRIPKQTARPGTSRMRRIDDFSDICPPGKNPLQLFHEFAQSQKLTCDVIETSPRTGPPHAYTFFMAARLDEEQFPTISGKSMSEAKNRATAAALRSLQKTGRYKVQSSQARPGGREIQTLETWSDKVAAEVIGKFERVISTVEENLSGRKVLAAILLHDKYTKRLSVISIGTGNRCVTGNNLCVDGNVINDSHAEVIAKRGFRRYLYSEIHKPHSGLLTRTPSGKLKLSPHLSIHLYISTAPCGDGAVFTRANPGNSSKHQPIFGSSHQGHLRTKMEHGEGTIPVDDAPQTLDGIRRQERLRTMSCSDKICRWNVVGLQGALLSLFVEPIYLSTITLGQLFSDGHMSRAMCCRVDRDSRALEGLPPGYKLQHPYLGCVTRLDDVRIVDKSRALSINWNSADDTVELTDGTHGKTIGNSTSRICKRSLFQLFIQTSKSNLNQTYRETKNMAEDYKTAKDVFVSAMSGYGYGEWVKKPPEIDVFHLRSSETNVDTRRAYTNNIRNNTHFWHLKY